jgi:hypothetical protein
MLLLAYDPLPDKQVDERLCPDTFLTRRDIHLFFVGTNKPHHKYDENDQYQEIFHGTLSPERMQKTPPSPESRVSYSLKPPSCLS